MSIDERQIIKETFKSCFNCVTHWSSRDEFLHDWKINLVGYQVHFEELTSGIFLFNHSCGSTLGLPVSKFMDLYQGEIFSERATGTVECSEYCLYRSNLEPCPVKCECAYIREIIQIIKAVPKI